MRTTFDDYAHSFLANYARIKQAVYYAVDASTLKMILKLIQIYELFCIDCRRDCYQHSHIYRD